ncbi:MAG: glucosamine-6-phosphate deaminase [Prolixibacteraceae bacterium]|nr:glucosamine-6-phosphate deaminase [Prolixibacteraceae bacterium]
MNKKPIEFKKDNLDVKIYQESDEIADAAAKFVADSLKTAIESNGVGRVILGTGNSQLAFIEKLQKQDIDWKKVVVFHLDEYKDMPETHPASFRKYLKERIMDHVKPKEVHYVNGDAPDIDAEIMRYSNLLKENPVDIACVGIGENGHLAFNDPPVADFNDPHLVKIITLDPGCRQQQFGEGWFPTLEDVPSEALTLTIPAIMSSKAISCLVPDERKARAVYNALNMDISTACPASILRKHPNAILFLDSHSSSLLKDIR